MSRVNPAEGERSAKLLAVCLVVFGIVLRLAGYFAHRSLWGDEVAIALNIRFRDLAGLMHPLDYEQTMPIPLLAVIKLLVSIFGASEYVLRLPLLVVGCFSLVVLWLVYRRLFCSRIALIALAMAVISRPLIYYSSEVKQYGLDALVTIITLWVGLEVLDRAEANWWKPTAWGVVALCLSQPAVFVLAAVGLAAALDHRFRASTRWRVHCLVATATWLVVFVVLYLASYRAVSHSPYMRAFWSSQFLHPGSPGLIRELSNSIYILLGVEHFDYLRAMILGPLFAVGLYGIWHQFGRRELVVALFPFFAVVAAAMVQQYPVANRLVLFMFPIVFWIYATALVTISDQFPAKLRTAAAAVLVLALLAPTAAKTVNYVLHFPQRETSRQVIAWMKSTDPSAPVYIGFDEYLPWAYYAGDWSHPEALKAKIALAFHAAHRIEFVDAAGNQEKKEIVGQLPPETLDATASDIRWTDSEAAAILALKEAHVWLFLPVYINNPVMGHTFQQRNLFEKLQQKLREGGARLVDKYSLGDSVALRYELPLVHSTAGNGQPDTAQVANSKPLN